MSPDPKRETYGPADVCWVIGIERGTFHSWLARKYVVIESQGAGRPRQLGYDQVVLFAAIADLLREGMPVGTAAALMKKVRQKFLDAANTNDGRDMIMIIKSGKATIGTRDFLLKVMDSLGVEKVAGKLKSVTNYRVLNIAALIHNVQRDLCEILDARDRKPDAA